MKTYKYICMFTNNMIWDIQNKFILNAKLEQCLDAFLFHSINNSILPKLCISYWWFRTLHMAVVFYVWVEITIVISFLLYLKILTYYTGIVFITTEGDNKKVWNKNRLLKTLTPLGCEANFRYQTRREYR